MFVFQIMLAAVPGTGKDGRILKEDIMHYIEGLKAKPAPPPTVDVGAAPTVLPTPVRRPEVMLQDRIEPIKGIKKAMAKAMSASIAIPHFGYKDEIILNELVR